ncbi:MAG: Ion transport protein [Frankiales bacterium]|nr:Ion transport protein [Frankiales bacterium]
MTVDARPAPALPEPVPENALETVVEAFEQARDADLPDGPAWQQAAHRLASSDAFGNVIVGLIVFNAMLLGLGTFDVVQEQAGGFLDVLDRVLLGIFTAELVVRLGAVGFRPWRFLDRGWNVFDVVAVAASYLPGIGGNATALRLIRLLRVARLLSVVPDVGVLLDGIRRALRPAAGLVVLTGLLVYLYGIVGWSLFGAKDPERWGNIGEACLTLFTLLTLEAWSDILADARAVSPWAVVYVLSFILIGTFVVLNLLVGVVITSLDEAHQSKRRDDSPDLDVTQALQAAREALDAMERKLLSGDR